jgi:hypothetical protein
VLTLHLSVLLRVGIEHALAHWGMWPLPGITSAALSWVLSVGLGPRIRYWGMCMLKVSSRVLERRESSAYCVSCIDSSFVTYRSAPSPLSGIAREKYEGSSV